MFSRRNRFLIISSTVGASELLSLPGPTPNRHSRNPGVALWTNILGTTMSLLSLRSALAMSPAVPYPDPASLNLLGTIPQRPEAAQLRVLRLAQDFAFVLGSKQAHHLETISCRTWKSSQSCLNLYRPTSSKREFPATSITADSSFAATRPAWLSMRSRNPWRAGSEVTSDTSSSCSSTMESYLVGSSSS